MAETVLVNAATVVAAASCAVVAFAASTDVVTFRVRCDQPHTLHFWGADATFSSTATAAEYADELRTYVSPTAGTGNLFLIDTGGKGFLACVVTNNGSESATVTVGAEDAENTDLALILKLLRNKTITDPATGVMTVYDDNGVDVLFTAAVYEGAGTTVPYSGEAINRRERLA